MICVIVPENKKWSLNALCREHMHKHRRLLETTSHAHVGPDGVHGHCRERTEAKFGSQTVTRNWRFR